MSLPKLGDTPILTHPIDFNLGAYFDVTCGGSFIGGIYTEEGSVLTQNMAEIFNCMAPAVACSGCESRAETLSNEEFRLAFQELQRSCCEDASGVVRADADVTSGTFFSNALFNDVRVEKVLYHHARVLSFFVGCQTCMFMWMKRTSTRITNYAERPTARS